MIMIAVTSGEAIDWYGDVKEPGDSRCWNIISHREVTWRGGSYNGGTPKPSRIRLFFCIETHGQNNSNCMWSIFGLMTICCGMCRTSNSLGGPARSKRWLIWAWMSSAPWKWNMACWKTLHSLIEWSVCLHVSSYGAPRFFQLIIFFMKIATWIV